MSYTPAQVRGMSQRDRDALASVVDEVNKQRALERLRADAKAKLGRSR
jgi:hypothetical protein